MTEAKQHKGMTKLVTAFLQGNLSVILILISLIVGIVAIAVTPREEDPQIVVPIADILVNMPGASAREVERQVSTPLEKLLYQIDGVEYVYSTSYASQAVVTVRFYVGEDRERSWVKLYNKINSNLDIVPPGVTGWAIKPVEIDDVPLINLTLYSARYSDYVLHRLAEELEIRLQSVKNAGKTYIVGGRQRQITVHLSPQRMAGRDVGIDAVERAIKSANGSLPAGSLIQGDKVIDLHAGRFLTTAGEVKNIVVGVKDMKPIFLKDVATVGDGPDEPDNYVRISFAKRAFSYMDPAAHGERKPASIQSDKDYPAVTVAVAKRRGTNAVWVSDEVLKEARNFERTALPEGVHLRVTRDYGQTADAKVNDLMEDLIVAIVIVVLLLSYTLGWREGIIIALAVPVTFSLTLIVNLLCHYTINRVTLFALILALGLVVDDPIVDVENIHRHFAMRNESPFDAIVSAVNEVRPPIILATLAVIISFLPMFFITGMMGPYMAPMALNVPIAMLASLLVAFTITPWLSLHMLKGSYDHPQKPYSIETDPLFKLYSRVLGPMFESPKLRRGLIALIAVLMAFAVLLIFTGRVPLKMLPFDNKNEMDVVIDMPEGTTLETTQAAAADIGRYLMGLPETTDVTTYSGTASPMDFNGLVRHYYLRQGPRYADVRVNFIDKQYRKYQSHAIALRTRDALTAIARRDGARIQIVENPPGPPVLDTLVAEVYGGIAEPYAKLVDAAKVVRSVMQKTPGVVDVDDFIVAPQKKIIFKIDRVKAALNGISDSEIAGALQGSVLGTRPSALMIDNEVRPVAIELRLPGQERALKADLMQLMITGAGGQKVFLSDLGTFVNTTIDQPIYHKNLQPVVYVFGDTAGLPPPNAVLELEKKLAHVPALKDVKVDWSGEGEWFITIRVFRDLGIAFGVAVLGIYILLLYQTRSYLLPAIQLIALPLSVIGILPGFWLLNLLTAHPVGGWDNPVFFTATAMIGMIALSGIATRNSILLIEFVEERKKEGKPLKRSLIEAGALRTRPILLTSLAAMLAAWPISLDPVFSGLAWALIFGIAVSTFFTLIVVPVVYFMAYGQKENGVKEKTVS
ncbi:MAG: efflux RND transporter permease subunit [Syntrophobacteraceae bacterium]|nr:efflux RND transporter permease subunit [Syntrophobacteraceae bacterium]